jgi:hypothetical protein
VKIAPQKSSEQHHEFVVAVLVLPLPRGFSIVKDSRSQFVFYYAKSIYSIATPPEAIAPRLKKVAVNGSDSGPFKHLYISVNRPQDELNPNLNLNLDPDLISRSDSENPIPSLKYSSGHWVGIQLALASTSRLRQERKPPPPRSLI